MQDNGASSHLSQWSEDRSTARRSAQPRAPGSIAARGRGPYHPQRSATAAAAPSSSTAITRFTSCSRAGGTDEFLALFGVETLHDATALEITQIIVLNGQSFVAKDSCGSLFASLVLMPLEDVYDSLPEGCGDDGEADG